MTSKKENILISISGIIFFVFYMIYSCFNRFAADDYYYIYNINKIGVWGNMLNDYFSWSGRWTVNLLWSLLYLNFNINWVLPLATTLLFTIFYISIVLVLKKIVIRFFPDHSLLKYPPQLLAIIFVQFVFFVSSGKGEIWFWPASFFTYLLSVSCFLTGYSLLFSGKKLSFIFSAIIIMCFVYAGGASESYTLNYFIIIVVSAMLIIKSPKIFSLASREIIFKRLIFFTTFMLISFIISVISPGDSTRMKALPEPTVFKGLLFSMKTLYHLVFLKFLPNIHYFILFIISWFFVGTSLNRSEKGKTFYSFTKKFFVSLTILVIITAIMIFPSCYTLSDIVPDRGLSQVIISWTAFFSAWAFKSGHHITISKNIASTLFRLSIVIMILNSAIVGFVQIPVMASYTKAFDKRTSLLKELQKKGNTKTITLNKLPPSGFLYSAEISKDSSYFVNVHLQKGLLLDFNIKLR